MNDNIKEYLIVVAIVVVGGVLIVFAIKGLWMLIHDLLLMFEWIYPWLTVIGLSLLCIGVLALVGTLLYTWSKHLSDRAEQRKRVRRSLSAKVNEMTGEFTARDLADNYSDVDIAEEVLFECCESDQLEQITRGSALRYRFPFTATKGLAETERFFLDAIEQLGGVVSIMGLAIHTGVPLFECDEFLKEMSAKGYAELHVCNGHFRYNFPGISDKDAAVIDPLESGMGQRVVS